MKRTFNKILSGVLVAAICIAFSACRDEYDEIPVYDLSEITEETEDIEAEETEARHRARGGMSSYLNGQPAWIDTVDITITPCGKFDFPYGNAPIYYNYTESFSKIYIDYTDCEPGRKNIICEASHPAYINNLWVSVFDMYTGLSFEARNTGYSFSEGCRNVYYHDHELTIGDYTFPISWTFVVEQNDYIVTYQCIVNCPEEYDGAVFQFGTAQVYHPDYDFVTNTYTADELMYFGDEYYEYFSLSSLPENAL